MSRLSGTRFTGEWDPGSIANGADANQSFTIPGVTAQRGDLVFAAPNAGPTSLFWTAQINSSGQIVVNLGNLSGSAQDLEPVGGASSITWTLVHIPAEQFA